MGFSRALASTLAVALALGAPLARSVEPARGATPYVDGIADQNLARWDAGFATSPLAGWVASDLVAGGRITIARYAMQWNAFGIDASTEDAPGFLAWCADASSLGLTLELAPTDYRGRGVGPPATVAAYEREVDAALQACPALRAGVLEAWNEPNDANDGAREAPGSTYLTPARAAALMNAAYRICHTAGNDCTAVAGDFEDAQAHLAHYETEYEEALDPAEYPRTAKILDSAGRIHVVGDPLNWGLHPYEAINRHRLAPAETFKAHLPGGGAGDSVWLTEAGAYLCHDGVEWDQTAAVAFLLGPLMSYLQPVHVDYFELMAGEGKTIDPGGCAAGGTDSELFASDDVPRPAAYEVFDSLGIERSVGPAAPTQRRRNLQAMPLGRAVRGPRAPRPQLRPGP